MRRAGRRPKECFPSIRLITTSKPCSRDLAAALSNSCAGREPSLRTVISISERMPEIGRKLYETGPAEGVAKVRHYLESQVAAGNLMIEDCEVAAAQFLDSCLATILKPLLFNAGDAPADERINHVVGIAVRTFLAAYRRGA
jgi:AefR-like transcriptional repressor, C-terminal domain